MRLAGLAQAVRFVTRERFSLVLIDHGLCTQIGGHDGVFTIFNAG